MSSPTIRSLAKTLNISRTTVSDALRGSPRVRPDTAKRIWEAANAVGYKPNPLAGALMSEIRRSQGKSFRGGLAAVDLEEPERPNLGKRFHEALVEGAKKRAAELGYKLQPFLISERGIQVSRLDAILQSRGIQGVLLQPSWRDPDLSKLDWSRYSGIYTDYIIEHPALHAVCCDHYRSLLDVLNRLKRLGYKRPGIFLQSHQDDRLQNRWKAAFLAFQGNNLIDFHVPALVTEQFSKTTFKAWLKKYKPDVVLGHYAPAIDWIKECNLKVPEEVGFFCLNLTQVDTHQCSGLDLQPRLIGSRAVELLIAQLQRNERGIPEKASTTMIAAQWIEGPTLISKLIS
jgi:LacI family transcriptional regulator